MSKLAQRLAKRIRTESGLTVEPKINRIYAGRHMRATGCWLWSMKVTNLGDGLYLVGSGSRALDCAKAKRITITTDKFSPSDYTIDVYNK